MHGSLRKHSTAPPEGHCSPPAQQLSGVPALRTSLPPGSPGPGPAPRLLPSAPRLSSPGPHGKQNGAASAPQPKGCSCCQSSASLSELAAGPARPAPAKSAGTVRALRRRPASFSEPEGPGCSLTPSSAKSTTDSPVLLQLAWFHSPPIQQELTPA